MHFKLLLPYYNSSSNQKFSAFNSRIYSIIYLGITDHNIFYHTFHNPFLMFYQSVNHKQLQHKTFFNWLLLRTFQIIFLWQYLIFWEFKPFLIFILRYHGLSVSRNTSSITTEKGFQKLSKLCLWLKNFSIWVLIHLNFSYRPCFEQGAPWHLGNFRV